jgi:hypothetical protein
MNQLLLDTCMKKKSKNINEKLFKKNKYFILIYFNKTIISIKSIY